MAGPQFSGRDGGGGVGGLGVTLLPSRLFPSAPLRERDSKNPGSSDG